jgi:Nucleotide-diphospho-sugar transferase
LEVSVNTQAGDLRAPRIGPNDIARLQPDIPWVVGAWFTPNYRHWADRLRDSLDTLNAPYHMLARPLRGEGWEAQTMQKPGVVRELMVNYPDKVLVLVDADCIVLKSPASLVDSVRGDIAAYLRPGKADRAKNRARFKIMSGTMVFRPTDGARRFVDAWIACGTDCDPGDVDQTSLMLAMSRTSGFTFEPLDQEWCDFEKTHADPAILHENASSDVRKRSWIDAAKTRLQQVAGLRP